MFAASAIHIGANNALLDAFEAATDHASYYPAFAAVEQAINSDELNGLLMEASRVRREWTRINNGHKPMLAAQFRAIRTYSIAELMERSNPQTAEDATDALCAALVSRNERRDQFYDAVERALFEPVTEAAE